MMEPLKLTSCPGTLANGYTMYSPACLRRMFKGRKVRPFLDYLPAEDSEQDAQKFIENRKHISISGVQEKISLLLDKNRLRLTEKNEQGQYILKPIPRDISNPQQLPANEHLTMQIARQVYGIATAENAMIFFKNGQPAYLTRRFDVNDDGSKKRQEDFASLAGKTEQNAGKAYKYSGSYEQLADIIKQYVAAYPVELEKFYRLILFNYLFCNGDAHLKNFSLQETPSGDFILSPAYDLLNTRIHVNDADFALENGLFKDDYESTSFKQQGYACSEEFKEFGIRIGLRKSRADAILQKFSEKQQKVYILAENSFLDSATQTKYLQLYEDRLKRFRQ